VVGVDKGGGVLACWANVALEKQFYYSDNNKENTYGSNQNQARPFWIICNVLIDEIFMLA
jgi:hypothetical protein